MNTQSNLRKVVKKWNEKRDNARYEIDRTDDQKEVDSTSDEEVVVVVVVGNQFLLFISFFFYQKSKKIKFHFVHFFPDECAAKKMQSEPSSDFSHMNFVFSFIFFPFLFIWFFFGFFSAIFGAADRRGNGRRTMAAWDFYFFFLVVFFKVIKLS